MVLICGILLGPGLGALAAGIGSMMADLIGGYMAWVPGTFAIKALTALLGGWLYHRMAGKGMNTITRVVLCGILQRSLWFWATLCMRSAWKS